MNTCVNFWKCKEELWSQINNEKCVFEEPRDGPKEKFQTTMKQYYAAIDNPTGKGAIFMAVMGGKVSEGLDFADKYGRAVIITGIPFAPCFDPKITLKQKYLDDIRSEDREKISGKEWYRLMAFRSINQAIGRIIRHKDDYGAILFCDNRFFDSINQKNISEWVKHHLDKTVVTFEETSQSLRVFFRDAEKMVSFSWT